MDIQQLKQLAFNLRPKPRAWDVDFQNETETASNIDFESIKRYVIIAELFIIGILGCMSLWAEINYRRTLSQLNDHKDFLAKNTNAQQKILQNNKIFLSEKDKIDVLLKNYQFALDCNRCLIEICKTKPTQIRFSSITIDSSSNQNVSILMSGILQEDFSVLEDYRKNFLNMSCVQSFSKKCKCFFNLNNNSLDKAQEIPFTFTFQNNG